jgi:hypothetical protein
MDILLVIILVEFFTLLLYFVYAEIYFLLSIIIFMLYFIFKYNDGDEWTGFRSWGWLRRRTLFGKSCTYFFGNPLAFKSEHVRERMLFLVTNGGSTNMGLIHGFSMHGGTFQHLDLVVMLPWIFFKIPLLRDILLWMGGVSTPVGSSDLVETQILHLLRKGKSVVYSVAKGLDHSSGLFEFCIRHKVLVVPVTIKGENARYNVLSFPYPWIQEWFNMRIGWPFPYWFFPRIFNKKPLERLMIHIGTPMDGSIQENSTKFMELFRGQFGEIV